MVAAMSEDLKAIHQRPEGKLIEDAMSRIPKMSARRLAGAVEMSDARVRQIINGYSTQGGRAFPVKGPAKTVARLGLVLDIAPAAFMNADRKDVADAMADLAPDALPEDIDWAKVGDLDDHAAAFTGEVNINLMFSQAVRFAATVGVLVPEAREEAEQVSVAISELFTHAYEKWDRILPEDRVTEDDEPVILKLDGGDGNAENRDPRSPAATSDPSSGSELDIKFSETTAESIVLPEETHTPPDDAAQS